MAIALVARSEEFRQKPEDVKKRGAEKGGDTMGGQQSDMSEALNQKQTERSRSMKLTQGVFASVLCLGLSVQAFAGSFEGVVTMKETSDGEATLKKTYFKGDKMREDHSEGGYMVWDAAKKEGLIVDAKKRTVIVMP